MKRKIIVYDMNYFYAQVEERDNPRLRGLPVVVGGMPNERGGIVATCNYEARAFGIHAGMPSGDAQRLCRNTIFIYPRMSYYGEISHQIHMICSEYSDRIEYVALDEGYIDVTNTEWLFGGADKMALELQGKIFEKTGLTCSVGVGYSKMSAKLAAGMIKPSGYFNMDTREKWLEVMSEKNVEKISGIGDKIQLRLNNIGIHTIKDLQNADIFILRREFKRVGSEWLHAVAWGYDERDVITEYTEKSIGRSCTLEKNTKDWAFIKNTMIDLIKIVCFKAQKRKEYATFICLKIRYADFQSITRTKSFPEGTNEPTEVLEIIMELWGRCEKNEDIRAIGVSLGEFRKSKVKQIALGEDYDMEKKAKVAKLKAEIRNKFGYKVIEEVIDCEKEKDKYGKVVRRTYLRI